MSIRIRLAVGIILALAALVLAQAKPDFSGEWILNRQASTLSAIAAVVQSGVVQIEHQDPTERFNLASLKQSASIFLIHTIADLSWWQ